MFEHPVIFLDIDGVLNSATGFMVEPRENYLWAPNARAFYEAVKDIPNIRIVISSSWRGGTVDDFLGFVARTADFSLFAPLVPYLHADYATKRLWDKENNHKRRGVEIAEWLSRHTEIDKYLCIDDDSDFLRDQPLLLTDRTIGFCYRDMEFVKKFFGCEIKVWNPEYLYRKRSSFFKKYLA